MKKLLLTAAFVGFSSFGFAQASGPFSAGYTALLAGWDFDNSSSLAPTAVNARYSDIFGNTRASAGIASNPGNSSWGVMSFNGNVGSTNVATAESGSDIDRDVISSSNIQDLGSLGNTNEASINLSSNRTFSLSFSGTSAAAHPISPNVAFKDISIRFYGSDLGSTPGGVTINWFYATSLAGTTTPVSTGLSTVVTGSPFSAYDVNFSGVTSLNGLTTGYLLGQLVESSADASFRMDNFAVYGVAIPEPSTYAAILGALTLGVVGIRRRFMAKA